MSWRCDIKRKIILSLVSIVLILALTASSACIPKRTDSTNPASTTTSTTSNDANRFTIIEKDIKQLQSRVASIPASENYDRDIVSLQGDIESIHDELDSIREDMDDTLAEIEDMLADWEEEQTTQEASNTSVKWSWDVTSNYGEDVIIDYWQTPSRMESEGDYTIKVTLMNNKRDVSDNLTAISDLILDITYTPTGQPYVDKDNTFFDTVSQPYTMWDTDIVTRTTDGYCRRIGNMSEKIKLDAGEELQLKLDFCLTYK